MSDITIEAFEDEVTTFLEANATLKEAERTFEWGQGTDDVSLFEEISREQEMASLAKAQALAGHALRRRTGLDQRAVDLRRTRAARGLRPALRPARRALQGARPGLLRHRSGHGGAHDPGARHRRGARRLPGQALPGRPGGLPAVQRTRCRIGSGRPADPGRPRRRRVDPQRTEGVDLGRPVQRHRRDHLPHRSRHAQAQGADGVRGGHARARCRGAPAAPDDGRRVVQRGLLHRRAGARQPPIWATSTRVGRWRSPP